MSRTLSRTYSEIAGGWFTLMFFSHTPWLVSAARSTDTGALPPSLSAARFQIDVFGSPAEILVHPHAPAMISRTRHTRAPDVT